MTRITQTAKVTVLVFAIMTILAIGTGLVASHTEPPKDNGTPVVASVSTPLGMCPTEDSCSTPDYRSGAWHISGNGREWSSPIGLCPSEDSCTADFYGSGWNITALVSDAPDGLCNAEDSSPAWWQDPDCTAVTGG